MKTKEELNSLKEEVETMSKKLHELTDEELEQVVGGAPHGKVDFVHVTAKDAIVAIGGKDVKATVVTIGKGDTVAMALAEGVAGQR